MIENIVTAAKDLNIKTFVNIYPRESTDLCVARIDLSFSNVVKPILADHIWRRQTNRKNYRKTKVSEKIYSGLKDCVSGFEGVDVHFVKDSYDLKKLGLIVYRADLIRNQIRSVHEHLHSKIRYTRAEAQRKGDGFHIKNLEAGFLGNMVLKATRSWSVMNLANHAGLDKMIAYNSFKGILNSGGAALVTVNDFDRKSFVLGGRAMEKIWLTLTRNGISFQPMTAVTLFLNRLNSEGEKNFSKSHLVLLKDIINDYKKIFPGVDINKHGQIMLFRMGYSKEVEVNTLRKPLDEFII